MSELGASFGRRSSGMRLSDQSGGAGEGFPG